MRSVNRGPSYIPRELWSSTPHRDEVVALLRRPNGGVHVVDFETGEQVVYVVIPQNEIE